MFKVRNQIQAALKMMDVHIRYIEIAHIDNLYLKPIDSYLFKTGIYNPEEGVAFLLKHYESITIQKQEISND